MELFKKIVDYFINEKDVQAVFVYGSYARGNPGPFSDIDLGLLMEASQKSTANKNCERYMLELSRVLRKDPNIVILNFAGELLLKQVFSKGRCLLVKDQKALSIYKMAAYAKIAEFGYYSRSIGKSFVQKVIQGQ